MLKEKIIKKLQELTSHKDVEITSRGNSAISSALSILPKDKKLLIPEEGGWIHYKIGPKKLGITVVEVKCNEAVIDLQDLEDKLKTKQFYALLYQNPGGYFADQPIEQIFQLCKKYACLVILDVSGAIGTKLCDGKYADIQVGSFGEGKLVEAKVGGFISSNSEELFLKLDLFIEPLHDSHSLEIILEKLQLLNSRIKYLTSIRKNIIADLHPFNISHRDDMGFVVVIKLDNPQAIVSQRDEIIDYCQTHHLEWTECPRYIRLNQNAISIEVKQLSGGE
ncbi:aminotransferase class I/II-fold pyridoxal phosphate-dependent enzyme [Candidatus Woesearchaeota archaeon]|nr:aminotransferase class I/II-fold pyridoxal phosphate-dependent enzyme [Candidatus Woesearchaeota archaeon]